MNFDAASAQLHKDARAVLEYVTHPNRGEGREDMLVLVGRLEGLALVLAGMKEPKGAPKS